MASCLHVVVMGCLVANSVLYSSMLQVLVFQRYILALLCQGRVCDGSEHARSAALLDPDILVHSRVLQVLMLICYVSTFCRRGLTVDLGAFSGPVISQVKVSEPLHASIVHRGCVTEYKLSC